MDRREAHRHLAALLAECRPDWNIQTIYAQLDKVAGRPLPAVMCASALATAQLDAAASIISEDGPHWVQAPRIIQKPKPVPPARDPSARAAEARAQIRKD